MADEDTLDLDTLLFARRDSASPLSTPSKVWVVWQGATLICSSRMGLSERAARGKVENERRLGFHMEAKPWSGNEWE